MSSRLPIRQWLPHRLNQSRRATLLPSQRSPNAQAAGQSERICASCGLTTQQSDRIAVALMAAKEEITKAVRILRSGGLVVFPTETVYGLGANALDAAAVRKIFELKGRPASSPLIVHIATIEQARELASDWSDVAERLARQYWPGPLTLVVPKKAFVPDEVTAGLPTVGLRIPRHAVALDLLKAVGLPIAAPSANRFTQLSPTTAQHVREAFGTDTPFLLDGGPCDVGIESTVVAVTDDGLEVLRPGMAFVESAIGVEELDARCSPFARSTQKALQPAYASAIGK